MTYPFYQTSMSAVSTSLTYQRWLLCLFWIPSPNTLLYYMNKPISKTSESYLKKRQEKLVDIISVWIKSLPLWLTYKGICIFQVTVKHLMMQIVPVILFGWEYIETLHKMTHQKYLMSLSCLGLLLFIYFMSIQG